MQEARTDTKTSRSTEVNPGGLRLTDRWVLPSCMGESLGDGETVEDTWTRGRTSSSSERQIRTPADLYYCCLDLFLTSSR